MTEEEKALALRDLYRDRYPEITSFWIDLGRQAHWELTVEGLCGRNPQRLLPAPISFSDFQASLLQSIASSLGLTYEQMARDYTSAEKSAAEESARWWRAFFRYEAEQRMIIQRWAAPFFDRVYREVLREYSLRVLLGYDPQRLLPPPRRP